MEVAYGNPYLMRTHTAPSRGLQNPAKPTSNMNGNYPPPNPHILSRAHTSSNHSMQSKESSRSSDTTQGTTNSTLFPPPLGSGPTSNGGGPNGNDVTPTVNIMNSVAHASASLFQVGVALRKRLLAVPGFEEDLMDEEADAGEDTDPVTLLWRFFRRGFPLIYLYNALEISAPLQVNATLKDEKKPKAATLKFLQACMNELKFPQDECFIVMDLYGDDTSGFVKVTRVVNRVLDMLVKRGLIDDVQPTATDFENANKSLKRTQRQHIVSELVTTERTYVQHLELLQSFRHLVEEKGIIPGDAIHDIFLNLKPLLDFQRRFLIRVEQTNALPEEEQNWGKLFLLYMDAFKVYEPYIANQRKCEKTVVAEYNKLKDAGGSIEMRQMVESSTALYGFLMKPFQRLSKYPLLLEDLYKKGDLDEARRNDLLDGKEAATSVLSRTNHAVDREEKAEAVQELKLRVEDWKGHRVEGFGELLLYGTFTVLKSENLAVGKDAERQYHVYLFETILLCCKDIDPSKPKNKLASKPMVDKRGKPKLQLKGRIFMQNVTDLISLCKPGMDPHLLIKSTERIFWKGDPGIENFIIRFVSEDMMKKWAQQIEVQRSQFRGRSARNSDGSRFGGTSQTEFEFMRNQNALENPYATHAEEDEDDAETLVASGQPSWASSSQAPYHSSASSLSQSRNASQTSLRSRSTTGDSGGPPLSAAAQSRVPPPRFQPGSLAQQTQPQLSLRTRELQAQMVSPAERGGPNDSYFSPTPESPMSSARTSSSSSMYPFPRQPLPQQAHNGYYDEQQAHPHNQSRFTAPAMCRPPPNASNGYPPQAMRGNPPRPGAGMHSAQSAAPRNRSASSPDVQGQQQRARNGAPQPPVPDMPQAYNHQPYPPHMLPRSQSNSPSLAQQQRAPSQSPQMVRSGRQGSHQEPSPTNGPYPNYPLSSTPLSRTTTPSSSTGPPAPTQLKVKVHAPSAAQVLTLVVPVNISYQSLKDRIDAKLQRSTNLSLGSGAGKSTGENVVKLKYLDDEDYVTIQTDEDVAEAFESWTKGGDGGEGGSGMGMGEVELFCQR
ncbi:hypothetical protein B0A48_01440 [Cryoendolithus antarcticus]|uniref:DH domain-containing protein n=1 Tax=Cryoendolithus antarcticus TaxID=1507870 RepID=A0A1V8TPT4_9PEZI|nr:hypothetical protein B0A48_01440 [Cryoendolithus antarcticus]